MKFVKYFLIIPIIGIYCDVISVEVCHNIINILKSVVGSYNILTFVSKHNYYDEERLSMVKCIHHNYVASSIQYTPKSKIFPGAGIGMQANSPQYIYIAIAGSWTEMWEELIISVHKNPTSRWVLMINDTNTNETETQIIKLWTEHKLLNTITLHLDKSVDNNKFSCFITLYNPFALNNDTTRGRFYHYLFNYANNNEVLLKTINNFSSKILINLEQYPMKVNIFEAQFLSALSKNESNEKIRYNLLDGDALYLIEKSMNFKTIYIPSEDEFYYGNNVNNTLTGALKLVEKGKCDLSANSRLISNTRTSNTVYLYPIDVATMNYVVAKRHNKLKLNVFVLSLYNTEVQIIFSAILLIFSIVWFILDWFNVNYVEKRTKELKNNSLIKILVIIIGAQHSISQKNFKKRFERFLYVSLLLSCLITCNTYQGTVISQLSKQSNADNLMTVAQLLKTDLNITAFIIIRDLFKTPPKDTNVNSILYQLYKRQTIITQFTFDMDKVVEGTTAILLRKNLVWHTVADLVDNITGDSLLHVIPESPIAFYTSFLVPKTSPFIDRFNQIIQFIKQSGFNKYSEDQAKYNAKMYYIKRAKTHHYIAPNTATKISIFHLSSLFTVWAYSLSVSLIIFLIEILIHNLTRKKKNQSLLKKIIK